MKLDRLSSDRIENNAEIILEVASAIGAHLELSDVLAALVETLNPIIHFDAISIVILEGEAVRTHWAHVEGFPRSAGESLESVVGRYASSIKVEPPPLTLPVSHHPISEIMVSGKPYVASDLESLSRFDTDEPLLNNGFRSYIDLPLIKQGTLIGTIKFLSKEKGNYTGNQVRLLQDVADIVSIAVSNALAFIRIFSYKPREHARRVTPLLRRFFLFTWRRPYRRLDWIRKPVAD